MPRPLPPPPRGRRSALRHRADGNVATVSHGHTFPRPPLQPLDAPTRRWAKRPRNLNVWPFDLEIGVRITCDVGYLCANFGLPIGAFVWRLTSVLDIGTMYATDRQTPESDVRRQTKASLNAPPIRSGGIIKLSTSPDVCMHTTS